MGESRKSVRTGLENGRKKIRENKQTSSKKKGRLAGQEKVRRHWRFGGEYIANTVDLDGRVRDLQIPRRKQHSSA